MGLDCGFGDALSHCHSVTFTIITNMIITNIYFIITNTDDHYGEINPCHERTNE